MRGTKLGTCLHRLALDSPIVELWSWNAISSGVPKPFLLLISTSIRQAMSMVVGATARTPHPRSLVVELVIACP